MPAFLHSLAYGCQEPDGGAGGLTGEQTVVPRLVRDALFLRRAIACVWIVLVETKRAVPRLENGTALGSCYSMSRIISWRSPVCSRACWLFCSWFCRELACHSWRSVCSSWHSTGIFSGSLPCTLCRCSWCTCTLGNSLYTLCICNRCICTLSYCIPFCSTRFSLCCRLCFEQQPVKR